MMLLLAQRVRANYFERFASKSCTVDGKMTAIHVVMKQGEVTEASLIVCVRERACACVCL